ncbi:MAG: hypothetical protein WC511_01865 [Candidatus Pacearchaeota archaeon]
MNFISSCERASWRVLYPDIKKRKLAKVYQKLHQFLPGIFKTFDLTPKWYHDVFPFKIETEKYDMDAGEYVDCYHAVIYFEDLTRMLISANIKPSIPLEYISLSICLTKDKCEFVDMVKGI